MKAKPAPNCSLYAHNALDTLFQMVWGVPKGCGFLEEGFRDAVKHFVQTYSWRTSSPVA